MNFQKGLAGLTAAALLAVAGPALAAHGKIGLWNITSTVDVAMAPNLAAEMKKSGIVMPASQPTNVQMCMSKEEVESNTPPHLDSAATGCKTRLVTQNAQFMRADISCSGQMKGTGRIEVAYKGSEHYSGTYSFNGTSYGRSTRMTTTFKGDWVKADCGKVPTYKLRTQ